MIIERLKEYIDRKKMKIASFEKKAGLANATFSIAYRRGKSISTDTLEKILSVYDDINPSWLLRGEGEMLTSDKVESNTWVSIIEKNNKTIQEQAMEIGRLQERVRQLEQQVSDYQKKYAAEPLRGEYGMVAESMDYARK